MVNFVLPKTNSYLDSWSDTACCDSSWLRSSISSQYTLSKTQVPDVSALPGKTNMLKCHGQISNKGPLFHLGS